MFSNRKLTVIPDNKLDLYMIEQCHRCNIYGLCCGSILAVEIKKKVTTVIVWMKTHGVTKMA